MRDYRKFYIDGQWVDPLVADEKEVINPATMEPAGVVSKGSEADTDAAVAAAKKALETWSNSSREERIAVLQKAMAIYAERTEDVALAVTEQMGAPFHALSQPFQSQLPLATFQIILKILENFEFEKPNGPSTIVHDPVGVCALITPWNWPAHQVVGKVVPAIAAGCTMVLKPALLAPFDAYILAEVLHEAGLPAGVFNLVNGDGSVVGNHLSSHPDVNLVSFTGSTRAGKMVYEAGADTMKRLALELGGKSPNILLEDADMAQAVTQGVKAVMLNTGQTCNAPTRMLVHESKLAEAEEIAKQVCSALVVGDPMDPETIIGPAANHAQYNTVINMIETGIQDGAKLVCGGPEMPDGLECGCYIKPTVFTTDNNMHIAREEIFGPVLCIIPYKDEEEAISMANDSPYGLSAYVHSSDFERARKVARRLQAGQVYINGAMQDLQSPYGGYKMSGIGREYGLYGFEEYLEIKAVVNDAPDRATEEHQLMFF